jgi:hypothetical protein
MQVVVAVLTPWKVPRIRPQLLRCALPNSPARGAFRLFSGSAARSRRSEFFGRGDRVQCRRASTMDSTTMSAARGVGIAQPLAFVLRGRVNSFAVARVGLPRAVISQPPFNQPTLASFPVLMTAIFCHNLPKTTKRSSMMKDDALLLCVFPIQWRYFSHFL